MRLYPANKISLIYVTALAAVVLSGFFMPAVAQVTPNPAEMQKMMMEQLEQQLSGAGLPSSSAPDPRRTAGADALAAAMSQEATTSNNLSQEDLGMMLANEDSSQSKAHRLADQRAQQRELEELFNTSDGFDRDGFSPPPLLGALIDLKGGEYEGTGLELATDGDITGDGDLDLRRDAQREAALSYGARGGLARRNYEIMQRMRAFENTLDSVFHFRALLINAPSGMLIEPPIIRESLDSMVITKGGSEAAVADQILNINKAAKIVSAPRDWREYLLHAWTSVVPKPPRILWPKNMAERKRWKMWVRDGWQAGITQANEMFDANLSRLVSDYKGMVRYRMLLAKGMVSQPYALHEDRGVTGTKTVMRVGDRALRITGQSQFLLGSDAWNPADR